MLTDKRLEYCTAGAPLQGSGATKWMMQADKHGVSGVFRLDNGRLGPSRQRSTLRLSWSRTLLPPACSRRFGDSPRFVLWIATEALAGTFCHPKRRSMLRLTHRGRMTASAADKLSANCCRSPFCSKADGRGLLQFTRSPGRRSSTDCGMVKPMDWPWAEPSFLYS